LADPVTHGKPIPQLSRREKGVARISHRLLRPTLLAAAGASAALALAPAALAQYEYPTPTPGTGTAAISIGNGSAVEGDAGMREVSFTVSLSMATDAAVSVRFEAVNWPGGTAGAGDFHGMTGVVIFAPGEVQKTITPAHAVGDTTDERNETFFVHLSDPSPNATINRHHGTGTIMDDDPPCTIMGTLGANVLRGTPGRDVMCGLGGNDALSGLGGNDLLIGGPGNDRLTGGGGRDVLRGGAGADTFLARDRRRDVVNGGAGRDRALVDAVDRVRLVERRI
jgi:Ca2+-binding RTX toxin-like protein